MANVQDLLDLIPSENAHQPNFVAVLRAECSGPVDIANTLLGMVADFNLDTAVGTQLDAIGEWVGITRRVTIPLTGVYFAWDTVGVGWEAGSWKGPFDPSSGLIDLPDDAYRVLLKATIAANHWDGTIPGAYAAWDVMFEGTGLSIIIHDNQDMTMDLGLVGRVPTAIEQALLTGGYLDLKPAAVGIRDYFVPVDDGPIFAWDMPASDDFAGWDAGSWAKIL